MVHYIYSMPLPAAGSVMFILVAMWAIINRRVNIKKQRRWMIKRLNLVLFLCIITVILYLTIFSRNTGVHEVCFVPLYSFVVAQEQSEMYRSMFMNVLLFVPFGLFFPYAQKETQRGKIKVTILSAFMLSVIIEALQYIFMLGRAEVDDVICNTLGAFVGTLSFVLYSALKETKD